MPRMCDAEEVVHSEETAPNDRGRHQSERNLAARPRHCRVACEFRTLTQKMSVDLQPLEVVVERLPRRHSRGSADYGTDCANQRRTLCGDERHAAREQVQQREPHPAWVRIDKPGSLVLIVYEAPRGATLLKIPGDSDNQGFLSYSMPYLPGAITPEGSTQCFIFLHSFQYGSPGEKSSSLASSTSMPNRYGGYPSATAASIKAR